MLLTLVGMEVGVVNLVSFFNFQKIFGVVYFLVEEASRYNGMFQSQRKVSHNRLVSASHIAYKIYVPSNVLS